MIVVANALGGTIVVCFASAVGTSVQNVNGCSESGLDSCILLSLIWNIVASYHVMHAWLVVLSILVDVESRCESEVAIGRNLVWVLKQDIGAVIALVQDSGEWSIVIVTSQLECPSAVVLLGCLRLCPKVPCPVCCVVAVTSSLASRAFSIFNVVQTTIILASASQIGGMCKHGRQFLRASDLEVITLTAESWELGYSHQEVVVCIFRISFREKLLILLFAEDALDLDDVIRF